MRTGLSMNASSPGQLYARAAPRLGAYIRDFFVYIGVLVALMTVAVSVGSSLVTRVSVIVYILFGLLYEPVCIAVTGGTIGHISQNLRIARASDLGPVSFIRALIRTVVKGLLGLWVFVAVYFTRRCQALHDLAAGTVVIPRKGNAPSSGFMVARRVAANGGSGTASVDAVLKP